METNGIPHCTGMGPRLLLLLLGVGAGLWPPGACSLDYTFGPDLELADDTVVCHPTDSAGQRGIAVAGDTIYVVWVKYGGSSSGPYLARSVDGGATFGTPVRVSEIPTTALWATVTLAPDGTVLVAWTDYRDLESSWGDIYFARSTNGGMTFSPSIRVDDSGSLQANQDFPCLAAGENGGVYLAWEDYRETYPYPLVYFTRSTDGGRTFEPNRRLTQEDWPWEYSPNLAVDDAGVLHAAWETGEGDERLAVHARSFDGGVSFTAPVVVGYCIVFGNDGVRLSMDTAGDSLVYVAWSAGSVYCARSGTAGVSFEPPVIANPGMLSDNPASIWVGPGSSVYIGWPRWGTYVSVSTDGGRSFPLTERVDDVDWNASSPTIAVGDGGEIYVAWTDHRDHEEDVYCDKGMPAEPTSVPTGLAPRRQLGRLNLSAVPNPVAFSCGIRVSVPAGVQGGSPTIRVLDTQGRVVRELEVPSSDGSGTIVWDTRDRQGDLVPSGIYFLEARCEGLSERAKVVVAR